MLQRFYQPMLCTPARGKLAMAQRGWTCWPGHRPRNAAENAMTARTAVVVMLSTVAQYLLPHRTPCPAHRTMPGLNVCELHRASPCRAYRRAMTAGSLLPIGVR